MKTILKIGRRLPEPIKIPLSWIYHKLNLDLKTDKDMVKDLAEYSHLSQKEVIWLLKSAERLDNDFWRILNPKTEKEIERFYNICPFYMFELAFWHMKKYQVEFRAEIIKFAKGKILDFGGGIGDLSIEFQKKGFDCDYADIYGRTFEFAEWLFRKKGCKISMIDLNCQKISEDYDTIYCIDTIEHFLNPKEKLNDLVARLKNDGRLIITNLNAPVSERHPMHFPMDFGATESFLNALGLFKGKESWLWIKSSK